jgi:hypothetical protein
LLFKCNFTGFSTKNILNYFYAVKNEAQMRQLFFFEKKDGCLLRQKLSPADQGLV